jgi:HPt (histidine-containing phosphotransfer) domain-containing protein
MIPLPPSNGLATRCGCPTRQDWWPPELLLEAAADDDGLIVKLIDAFSTDTDDRIEHMRGALAASDFPRIRAEAHTIKGSASQMGADALAEACRELEIASNLREALLIAPLLNRIQALFEEIRAAMASYAGNGKIESSVDTLV